MAVVKQTHSGEKSRVAVDWSCDSSNIIHPCASWCLTPCPLPDTKCHHFYITNYHNNDPWTTEQNSPASPPPPSPWPFRFWRMKYGFALSVIHNAPASNTSSGLTHIILVFKGTLNTQDGWWRPSNWSDQLLKPPMEAWLSPPRPFEYLLLLDVRAVRRACKCCYN